MPKTTTICLAGYLNEAIACSLRYRLDAQAGRVGMGANHGDGVTGLPFVADSECDNGGCVTGEVVLASGLEGGCP